MRTARAEGRSLPADRRRKDLRLHRAPLTRVDQVEKIAQTFEFVVVDTVELDAEACHRNTHVLRVARAHVDARSTDARDANVCSEMIAAGHRHPQRAAFVDLHVAEAIDFLEKRAG